MSEETKLLDCPHCGGEARINHWAGHDFSEVIVNCTECRTEIIRSSRSLEDAKRKAIAAWNTRMERECKMDLLTEETSDEIAEYQCSECKYIAYSHPNWILGYCPNCGAKVKEARQ